MRRYRIETFHMYGQPQVSYVEVQAHDAADAITIAKFRGIDVRGIQCVEGQPAVADPFERVEARKPGYDEDFEGTSVP